MLKKLGEKLFTFYCHPDFQEDIKGDLEEYYLFHLEERGQKYANRKYLIDVLQYNKIQGVPIAKSELKDFVNQIL